MSLCFQGFLETKRKRKETLNTFNRFNDYGGCPQASTHFPILGGQPPPELLDSLNILTLLDISLRFLMASRNS